MFYKSISSKYILADVSKVLRDKSTLDPADCIDWIGQAMEDASVKSGLQPKQIKITIANFRGKLPCDLAVLPGPVFYEGHRLPYSASNISWNCDDYMEDTRDVHGIPEEGIDDPDHAFYFLELDWIKTSFQEGSVIVHYLAYPTDDKGFPMIPDDHDFKEACRFRIYTQLILRGEKIANFTYDSADAYYERAVGRARTNGKMPNPDRMETLRRLDSSILKDYDSWQDSFLSSTSPDQPDMDV